jgi:hypothetical protein
MPADGAHDRDRQLATVAAAVKSTGAVRALARDLATQGVRMMILRGPPVQLRLLGSDTAYRSADVDVLIDAAHRRTAFGVLTRSGWRFSADNGVLWRIDGAAAFSREGITVDLHWGLHAGTVSARHLRPIERALWAGASRAAEGWYEPRIEALLVYLAVHGAASAFHKAASLTLVAAAAELATDLTAVEKLAREAHVWSAVRYALGVASGEAVKQPPPPVFDSPMRQIVSGGSRRIRSLSTVPAVRRGVRAVRSHRQRSV